MSWKPRHFKDFQSQRNFPKSLSSLLFGIWKLKELLLRFLCTWRFLHWLWLHWFHGLHGFYSLHWLWLTLSWYGMLSNWFSIWLRFLAECGRSKFHRYQVNLSMEAKLTEKSILTGPCCPLHLRVPSIWPQTLACSHSMEWHASRTRWKRDYQTISFRLFATSATAPCLQVANLKTGSPKKGLSCHDTASVVSAMEALCHLPDPVHVCSWQLSCSWFHSNYRLTEWKGVKTWEGNEWTKHNFFLSRLGPQSPPHLVRPVVAIQTATQPCK